MRIKGGLFLFVPLTILLIWGIGQVYGQPCPTVCVIIPETVIIERIPRPVPDPAAETSIIHHFLKYGFHVVNQTQVKFLRMSDPDLIKRAFEGDPTAIGELLKIVSERFAADVLVLGEAVSTVEVFEALRIPGRPRIQDGRARVEVRAIEARTGRILAAEAKHTGGIDFTAELAGEIPRTGREKDRLRAGAGNCPELPVPISLFQGMQDPPAYTGRASV